VDGRIAGNNTRVRPEGGILLNGAPRAANREIGVPGFHGPRLG